MNFDALLDKLTIYVSLPAFARNKYFRDGLISPGYAVHLEALEVAPPDFVREGFHELTTPSLAGELDLAFRVASWRGDDLPTIIYHHGTNENPYDRSFNSIFPHARVDIPANLIVVRAPFNASLKTFVRSIAQLNNYMAMLAGSVQLIEALTQACRARGAAPVVVTGISLGGWVTNLHLAYFGSADAYAPLLAGAALDDVFLDSIYSKLVAVETEAERTAVHTTMNFEDAFAQADHSGLYPLLARHDQYIRYARQRACYGDRPITLLDKSHVTAALAYADLRSHVLQAVRAAQHARANEIQ